MGVKLWMALFVLLFQDVFSLKGVMISIKPDIVERSQDATLVCSYDLEGAKLYYIKFYRGNHEFYRYTPSQNTTQQLFLLNGISVDLGRSNSTQVVLTDIDFQLSGNFSCEVTTAEEPASTETDVRSMLVVQFPALPPKISVGTDPLDYGDVLRANCSSPPSKPVARLKFILNDLPVGPPSIPPPRKSQEPSWSDLSLSLTLQEYHFDDGKLILRCVAQISDIYHEEAVLELSSARNPVPEKVSALDSAAAILSRHLGFCLALICLTVSL